MSSAVDKLIRPANQVVHSMNNGDHLNMALLFTNTLSNTEAISKAAENGCNNRGKKSFSQALKSPNSNASDIQNVRIQKSTAQLKKLALQLQILNIQKEIHQTVENTLQKVLETFTTSITNLAKQQNEATAGLKSAALARQLMKTSISLSNLKKKQNLRPQIFLISRLLVSTRVVLLKRKSLALLTQPLQDKNLLSNRLFLRLPDPPTD
ncbi:hypothetical protein JTE90_002772 [Oedothorax gibbosus]|uniref:Uncharacterized protein n=1 Tax=Oedothorax gibbosus TaxID=931172 RepID=A0AAV6TPM5_9ARAC|nr:hypothetical protein JTE90_002772 [Oedothorax gibbosus]